MRIQPKLFLFTAFFLMGTMATAHAARLQLAPFYGYRFGGTLTDEQTGHSVYIDPSASVGATASIALPSGHEYVEFLYSTQNSQLSKQIRGATINVRVDEWQLGINREFPFDDEQVKPFLVGLLGVTDMNFSNNLGSNSLFSIGMGGGIKYFPRPNIALRLDARAFVSFVEGSGGIACSGGCVASYHGSTFLQGEITPSLLIQF